MKTIVLEREARVCDAFSVPRGITAFVGGGGKTTLMLRLARELAESGHTVVVTTTTHIYPPKDVAQADAETLDEALSALLYTSCVCIGRPDGNGKLVKTGLPVEQLCMTADYVLVEADGAKGLPLKANAPHEPVVPESAALVIAVAGLDAVGKTIAETVHRESLYRALAGNPTGDIITPAVVARVLLHEDGQMRGVPQKARFAILLNKADDDLRAEYGKRIAACVREANAEKERVERVVIASLGTEKESGIC